MSDSPYTPSRSSHYTTRSTVPGSVRPELWRDWQRFWDRLRRRHSKENRRLEFKTGTPLRIEGTEYRIRYVDREWAFYLRLPGRGDEVKIRGSSAFGEGKPYVYADELQDALDRLIVQAIMEA